MTNHLSTATLGGGCFWCTEAIFKRLKGVVKVTSGFAGGKKPDPTYEDVHQEGSGYAESVQVKFDPTVIPYEKLLDIFWHTHNPTTLNGQDYDVGEEYRSVIFYHDEDQKKIAEKSKEGFEKSGIYKDPIVTQIVPYTNFYSSGPEHEDFYDRNRNNPYCVFITSPKIQKLLQEYSVDIKEEYTNGDV